MLGRTSSSGSSDPLTKDGQVKVLDFGLTKAPETASSSFELANSPASESPVLTTIFAKACYRWYDELAES
jgi:hypothetical protein